MSDRFKYEAMSEAGVITSGVISAVDDYHVEEFLAEQELRPISITKIRERKPFSFFGLINSNQTEDLIIITSSLATMQRAGVPMIKALSLIKVGARGSRMADALDRIRLEVQGGRSLSDSLSDFEDIFTPVYVAAVAAGEESGQLDQTLEELSRMLENDLELSRQIKLAIRYPIIVMIVLTAAFFVVMGLVIPRFIEFFDAFGAELPLATRILIGISNFITGYWYLVIGLTVLMAYGFKRLIDTESGRLWLDRRLLKLPGIGPIVTKGNVARFALMFRILFKAGIPLVRTLDILAKVVKNAEISREIQLMGELFRKGRDMGSITHKFKALPELALNMMSIGMESGSLDRMTEEIGKHYSKEVLYRSKQLTSIIEPILTIVLGIFVLVMALAIFLPMWGLITVFQTM